MNSPPAALDASSIDALLFDIGRVVLDIDFTRVLQVWSDHSGRMPDDIIARFSRGDVYMRHERGEISDDAFFAHLRDTLDIDLTPAQFLDGWNAIFVGEMPGIAELLPRAARRWPLYAFSNTNPAHVTHFSARHAELLEDAAGIFATYSCRRRSACASRMPKASIMSWQRSACRPDESCSSTISSTISTARAHAACRLCTSLRRTRWPTR